MSIFRQRLVRPHINGTSTSPQTGQLVTGSGNPALDELLGGGVPMNSIILIEEDKHCIYSKVLCKYFLAEGVVENQQIFLGCLDETPEDIFKKLPEPVFPYPLAEEAEQQEYDQLSMDTTSLRIAWRYNDLPYFNVEYNSRNSHHQFNLMNFMDEEKVANVPKVLWSGAEEDVETNSLEGDEIKKETLNDEEDEDEPQGDESSSALPPKRFFTNKRFTELADALPKILRSTEFCRICIQSLGSPLWYDKDFGQDLLKFLTILRAMVQNARCACFVTMPMHLISRTDETLVPKIRNLVDYAIELQSFSETDHEANPAFKDYNGLLHFRKVSAINSLALFRHSDLAFKLRRKKFTIQKFHLPPELEETTAECSDNCVPKSCTTGCANDMG